jgi:cytochrome c oxidase cbb3-type subunit I
MSPVLVSLLALSFLVGTVGLIALVWAITTDQFTNLAEGAQIIFRPGELNRADDPTARDPKALQSALEAASPDALPMEDLQNRVEADLSTRVPVLAFIGSAVFWLVVGSLFGLVVSIKFHEPDWWTSTGLLTFGRLRPLHLNVVVYGWLSMVGMGIGLWMLPRLLRTPLRGARWATAGAVLWNIGMVAGVAALFVGWTDALEWLEFPWQVDGFFVVGGALAAVPLLLTFRHRQVKHLYVSVWYITAALVWFPILFVIANMPYLHFGVEHALVNWWFAHNVLGLWFTPLGLATAYYLIPKIVGRPVHSYQLSLLGFWALALFYSQVGVHHLIGGPVPTWVVTLSIVTSVAMIVPVIAVAVNHHLTVLGRFKALLHSPVLRFVVLGAMLYTAASVQGSIEALRSVNTVTHFTHYTVGHAHLGVYGFASFVFFGAVYFILPRVTGREWPVRSLIDVHLGLALTGFAVYFTALTIGGWLQGQAMLDADTAFMESVILTEPYLVGRSVGGALMVLSHLIFGAHVVALLVKGAAPAAQVTRTRRPDTVRPVEAK